jgi:hypothetical protein
MRKLVVSNVMSLDGYFEGPGGNVMAPPMDGFFHEHNLERLRSADTLLLGSTTRRDGDDQRSKLRRRTMPPRFA